MNSDEGVRGSSHELEDWGYCYLTLKGSFQSLLCHHWAAICLSWTLSSNLYRAEWIWSWRIPCSMATMNVKKSVGGKPFQLLHAQHSRAERPQREVWFRSKKLEPLWGSKQKVARLTWLKSRDNSLYVVWEHLSWRQKNVSVTNTLLVTHTPLSDRTTEEYFRRTSRKMIIRLSQGGHPPRAHSPKTAPLSSLRFKGTW